MASQEPVIFWTDDQEKFFDLRIMKVCDLEEIQATTLELTFRKSKTWWNSNIPMDDFVPSVIPALSDDPLKMYFKRMRQRQEGVFAPVMPRILIRHGIMEIDKTGSIQVFLCTPDGFRKFNVTPVSEVLEVSNDGAERFPGSLYWNGLQYE